MYNGKIVNQRIKGFASIYGSSCTVRRYFNLLNMKKESTIQKQIILGVSIAVGLAMIGVFIIQLAALFSK